MNIQFKKVYSRSASLPSLRVRTVTANELVNEISKRIDISEGTDLPAPAPPEGRGVCHDLSAGIGRRPATEILPSHGKRKERRT